MVWAVRCARQDWTPGAHRAPCPRATQEPRIRGRQTREPHEARQAARPGQTTDAFRRQYAARAGIEGTHEHAMRRCGVRRSRAIGLVKTPLPHLSTATAIKMVRGTAWWEETPRAHTRRSACAALAASAHSQRALGAGPETSEAAWAANETPPWGARDAPSAPGGGAGSAGEDRQHIAQRRSCPASPANSLQ